MTFENTYKVGWQKSKNPVEGKLSRGPFLVLHLLCLGVWKEAIQWGGCKLTNKPTPHLVCGYASILSGDDNKNENASGFTAVERHRAEFPAFTRCGALFKLWQTDLNHVCYIWITSSDRIHLLNKYLLLSTRKER